MELEHQVVLGVFAALVLAGLCLPAKRKTTNDAEHYQADPLTVCPSCGHSVKSSSNGVTCTSCGYHYG
ncbi:MAG: hypothetical protein ACRBBS_17525 [Thalassovita sp.]